MVTDAELLRMYCDDERSIIWCARAADCAPCVMRNRLTALGVILRDRHAMTQTKREAHRTNIEPFAKEDHDGHVARVLAARAWGFIVDPNSWSDGGALFGRSAAE